MIKSKFEDKELGNKFIEMGNKFLTYAQENKTVLDFDKFTVRAEECGTVACHGGHACVIFNIEGSLWFSKGADAIAEFLGFIDYWGYLYWARDNYEYWGNKYGFGMFTKEGYKSFGFTERGKCTLVDIGNHYIAVGNRILNINRSVIKK